MTRYKILVVDDSEVVREVVRLTLEKAGYSVRTLDSAFQLNRAIRDDRPDLILLDVYMPALRGDQVAAILAQYRFSEGITVLLHSDMEEDRLAAMVDETGATGFIRKTADPAKLAAEVRRWLGTGRSKAEDRSPRRLRAAPRRHHLAS